jgi:ubiquinone/menaquinone biosynthesis C-methylase UbiE
MSPKLPLKFAEYTQELHEYAGDVMKNIEHDYRVKSVMQMVRQEAHGDICLEIGGGDGVMTTDLEKLFNIVLTTDFSASFLKRIESRTSRALCLYNDAHFLPVQDNKIDVILCSEVLEHVSIPSQLLFEIRRVMKKEGVCILSVPSEAQMELRKPNKMQHHFADDSHINFYSAQSLYKLLFRMGLQVVDIKLLSKPLLSFDSIKTLIRNPLNFLIRKITGQYILCSIKSLDDPMIYWNRLRNRIKQ